jgi:hypothetical protein
MGLVRFNSGYTSDNGILLHRMKPLPLTYQLYGQGSSGSSFKMPVVRSGAGDKSFANADATGIILYTTSSAGVATATATITYTTYLTSASAVANHMNSADQCLYVLIYASPSWRFVKVNDSTGVVTTIGSAFTPTTPTNWPNTGVGGGGTMEVDQSSGHLKVTFNGVYHLVNKSTGAIVSQDTALSSGSFLAHRVTYVTQDGLIGVSPDFNGSVSSAHTAFPSMVHSTYGHIQAYEIPTASVGVSWGRGGGGGVVLVPSTYILVDNDKVALGGLYALNKGVQLVSRTDYDKFIKSAAELGAGVI